MRDQERCPDPFRRIQRGALHQQGFALRRARITHPHGEGPLGEGFLDGLTVECPWHNGQWDITTGKGLTAFATADIRVFEVRVVDDDVEVKPTAAGASA